MGPSSCTPAPRELTEPSPPENRAWPCWGKMDTVKAVLVLFLGTYILLGEGPRWISSSGEGPVAEGSRFDGLQGMEWPEQPDRSRSDALEAELIGKAGGLVEPPCSGALEVPESGTEESLHLVASNPAPPPSTTRSTASAPPKRLSAVRGVDECLPGVPALPRAPGDLAH